MFLVVSHMGNSDTTFCSETLDQPVEHCQRFWVISDKVCQPFLIQPMEVIWDHHLRLNKTEHKASGLHLPPHGRSVIQLILSFILASLLSSDQKASYYCPIAVTIQAKHNLKLYNKERLWSTRTLPTTKILCLLSGSKEKTGTKAQPQPCF